MKSKGPFVPSLLDNAEEHPVIKLFFEYAQLKNLYRHGWIRDGVSIPSSRCESVADHCFGVALLSYIIAEEYFPELDSSRVMGLALVHDLGEVHFGDVTPFDGVSIDDKAAGELSSVEKVFSGFLNKDKYINLWKEYDSGSTPEALLVRQVDKLEMGFQAKLYSMQGFGSLEEFLDSARAAVSDGEIRDMLDAALKLGKI